MTIKIHRKGKLYHLDANGCGVCEFFGNTGYRSHGINWRAASGRLALPEYVKAEYGR